MSVPAHSIAATLALPERKVAAALRLFDEGATVPFVARYRKEKTGSLDETALRAILERRDLLAALSKRREAIRAALAEQGQLTPSLEGRLAACQTRADLEELYAPFKKKRKTRADKARELGLAPLAKRIKSQPREGDPEMDARRHVRPPAVPDVDAALAGARDIIAEELAAAPRHRAEVRSVVDRHGRVAAKLVADHPDAQRFRDYDRHDEAVARIASHRWLAIARGEELGALRVKVRSDVKRTVEHITGGCGVNSRSPYAGELAAAVADAVKRLLLPAAERAARAELTERAHDHAIDVFAKNLDALLLAAPLGSVPVLGVDPGIRTGCKCAAVDATGAVVGHDTAYLVGRSRPDTGPLDKLLRAHRPRAVAVGNGTGGREALDAVREAVSRLGFDAVVVSVNEAGASVYSASELAVAELGQFDVTVRGAVSIARRLQDPLAELVKIEPKSIGVGQYQHDVDQAKLMRRLGDVVESCVNRVGVDLNTASPALLGYVAGIGAKLASAVVSHREAEGPFTARRGLRKVAGLGAKTYEQCAGFLRIRDGTNPLDGSAVHPERYKLVERMAQDLGVRVAQLVGDGAEARRIDFARYEDADTGRETLADIVAELDRPGRDPRDSFEAPTFREDVREIGDLAVGMVLEGVVTNVTDFGAFVDVGVHRDGLVHISQLASGFVRSPHDVVRPGQRLRVKVVDVDQERKRIALSALLD